jgi:hypothetical protein
MSASQILAKGSENVCVIKTLKFFHQIKLCNFDVIEFSILSVKILN